MEKIKIGLTVGVFDLFHEGHYNLLKAISDKNRRTAVIVHDCVSTWKNKNRFPIQTLDHRIHNVRATKMADDIERAYNTDPSPEIRCIVGQLRSRYPECIITYYRGDDWRDFPGREEVEKLGIDIIYLPYTKGISSTQRREEICQK